MFPQREARRTALEQSSRQQRAYHKSSSWSGYKVLLLMQRCCVNRSLTKFVRKKYQWFFGWFSGSPNSVKYGTGLTYVPVSTVRAHLFRITNWYLQYLSSSFLYHSVVPYHTIQYAIPFLAILKIPKFTFLSPRIFFGNSTYPTVHYGTSTIPTSWVIPTESWTIIRTKQGNCVRVAFGNIIINWCIR